MNKHGVWSDVERSQERRVFLWFGILLGAIVAVVAMYWVERLAPPPVGAAIDAPEVVERSAERTVVRVPTRRGDALVICRVTIDHVRRSVAVSC